MSSPGHVTRFLTPYGTGETDCLNRLNVSQIRSAVQWHSCFRFFLPCFIRHARSSRPIERCHVFYSIFAFWHKKVLFHCHSCNQSVTWSHPRIEKYCFMPHWSRRTEKQYFSIFQHTEELWMRKWNAAVSVRLQSSGQPNSPIPPSRPFIGELGDNAAVAPRRGEKVTWAQLYCFIPLRWVTLAPPPWKQIGLYESNKPIKSKWL